MDNTQVVIRHAPSSSDDAEDMEPMDRPPADLIQQLWKATREGSQAFATFMRRGEWMDYDASVAFYSTNFMGDNFLHIAARLGDPVLLLVLARQLPALPADDTFGDQLPLERNEDGNTPLHVAAVCDHLDFVKALIKYKADILITSPIDVDVETVIDGCNVTPMSSYWHVGEAPSEGLRIISYLDIKNDFGRTAAEEALHQGATTTGEWIQAFRRQFKATD